MNSEEQVSGEYAGITGASGFISRMARSLVFRGMASLDSGRLTFLENGERTLFGPAGSELYATIAVNDPSFYRQIVSGGSLGAAGAYLDGKWDCDDLTSLIRIMLRNQDVQAHLEGGSARIYSLLQRLLHLLNDNTRKGSRRNIAAHYDLGNDFYQLFLDRTMAYSSGIFEQPESSMEEASRAKFDTICRRLGLQTGMSLLEIGTGWGGFAIHAARYYGCQVTTTTISDRQYEYAVQKVEEAGLSDQITLLRRDYRDLSGTFDRLVSIEMIEAVGHRHLPDFFRICGERLKQDGAALIQVITMPDHRYESYRKNPEFINSYIFPGGCCPSLTALSAAASVSTDLRLIWLQDIAQHYVRTLQQWRSSFNGGLDRVRAMGYSERFIRMWDYYLCYCEGAFSERYTGCLHLLYAKPSCRL